MKSRKKRASKKPVKAESAKARLLQELSSRGIRLKASVIRLFTGCYLAVLLLAATGAGAQSTVLDFKAVFTGTKTRLYWSAAAGPTLNYFSVERSWNGRDFETIGLVGPGQGSGALTTFQYIDKDYYTSIVYYRLRTVDNKLHATVCANLAGIQVSDESKEFNVSLLPDVPGAIYIDATRLDGEEIIVDAVDNEKQIVANAMLVRSQNKMSFNLVSMRTVKPASYVVSAFFDNRVLKTKIRISPASDSGAYKVTDPVPVNLTRK